MRRKFLIGAGIAIGLLLTVAILFPVFAKAKVTQYHFRLVNGLVVDGAGRPKPHEPLHLIGAGNTTVGEVETDAAGEVHLDRNLDVRGIHGYDRVGFRHASDGHVAATIYRFQGAIPYHLPDKRFGIDRIKKLRYAILIDDLDVPYIGLVHLPNNARDENTNDVESDDRGFFKFPADMKEPRIPEANVVGYIKANEKQIYAVYQGRPIEYRLQAHR